MLLPDEMAEKLEKYRVSASLRNRQDVFRHTFDFAFMKRFKDYVELGRDRLEARPDDETKVDRKVKADRMKKERKEKQEEARVLEFVRQINGTLEGSGKSRSVRYKVYVVETPNLVSEAEWSDPFINITEDTVKNQYRPDKESYDAAKANMDRIRAEKEAAKEKPDVESN